MKLNIGAGFKKREGFVNIDKFDASADMRMDAADLRFPDGAIDEIYSAHMLEHVSKFEVPKVLSEWYRVLKVGGKLELELPDLEWVCRNWLSKSDRERWGFFLDTIFGMETNEGEFHKTGFTKERIRQLLTDAGFSVQNVSAVWSHDQWCISVSAVKIKAGADEVFILDCFPSNAERTQLLREQISKLQTVGIPIILVSHTIIPEDIYKSVDYVVYDKRNIKSTTWDLQFFYQKPKTVKVLYSNPKGPGYHGVGCYSSLKNGTDLAATKFKFGHFVEYDVDFNVDRYLAGVRKQRRIGKKFIGFQYPEMGHPMVNTWGDRPRGIVTGLFSFDTELMRTVFAEVPDWKTWEEFGVADNFGLSLIFEIWLYNFLNKRILGGEQAYFDKKEEAEIIKNWNIYGIEGAIHFLISETVDHRLVIFAINVATSQKDFEWDLYDKHEKGSLAPNEFCFDIVEKIDGGKIFVKCGRFENTWIINRATAYTEARYLFYNSSLPRCITWKSSDTGDFLR